MKSVDWRPPLTLWQHGQANVIDPLERKTAKVSRLSSLEGPTLANHEPHQQWVAGSAAYSDELFSVAEPCFASHGSLVYQIRVPAGETLGVQALFAKHPLSEGDQAMLGGLGSTLGLVIQHAIAEDALRESECFAQATVDDFALSSRQITLPVAIGQDTTGLQSVREWDGWEIRVCDAFLLGLSSGGCDQRRRSKFVLPCILLTEQLAK
jgi:hypothetical protein